MLEHGIAPATGVAYEIEQSLRFNDDDSAYLSQNSGTGTNAKIGTFSCWAKINPKNSRRRLFYAYDGSSASQMEFEFGASGQSAEDNLHILFGGGGNYNITTSAKYRDASAWYHIVFAWDTTQAIASDRVSLYVNGEQVTSFSTATYPPQNTNAQFCAGNWNSYIGGSSGGYDGYMAETYFIDGQALDPSNFGETGDYGEWKPIEYTGTYGGNGFYLKMQKDETVEGFNTITYTGNGATSHSISGVGFTPDLVWLKGRSYAEHHNLTDAVRGVNKTLYSNRIEAEATSTTYLQSFDSDGFTIGHNHEINNNGQTFVAWCWDAGTGSAGSNTDGTITSTVKANTAYGFSVITYTGNGSTLQTVGHGLTSAPEMIICKCRTSTDYWGVYHKDVGTDGFMRLDSTAAKTTFGDAFPVVPTSSVFTIDNWDVTNRSAGSQLAYAFHSVAGYSKIGSYTGTGGANTVTFGFNPAFVMIKRTDSTGTWLMYDNTRGEDVYLYANNSNSEAGPDDIFDYTATGLEFSGGNADWNASGGSYIYMAFADTREYAFWRDYSGNNNNWTPNNLTETDEVKDSPTNNFCTLSSVAVDPSAFDQPELTEACLSVSTNGNSNSFALGTMSFTSGKWYFEQVVKSSNGGFIGITDVDIHQYDGSHLYDGGANPDGWGYYNNGNKLRDNNYQAYGSSFTTDDIVMCAFDMDNGKVWFGKNGTWQASGDPAAGTNAAYTNVSGTVAPRCGHYNNDAPDYMNFGQDSSFAGNKPAQGNTDDNGYGDFYYAPPTGFLALCTQNLPDATVIPSEHFNTVLYTGDGTSSHAITGVGFQPDFNWIKNRTTAVGHVLHDVVRGNNGSKYYYLSTNNTNAETVSADDDALFSLDTDGFTVGYTNGTAFNASGNTYVAWNWKANGAGVSNTDGTITSTVSANTDAGFSIVTYTGNATSGATVGHGLSKAPEVIIPKNRDSGTQYWKTYWQPLGATKNLSLSETAAAFTDSSIWNDTEPTASVFTIGNAGATNQNGANQLAYCFHSVDGYSKVGSYTGNGSTDGTFVYTGFRPKFIMLKKVTGGTGEWSMMNTEVSTYNKVNKRLAADSTAAEQTFDVMDILSNGFKFINGDGIWNSSGDSFIYIAFAEHPFKHTNAR